MASLQAPPGPPVPAPEAVPPLPSRPWHSQVRGRERGGERRAGEGKREGREDVMREKRGREVYIMLFQR